MSDIGSLVERLVEAGLSVGEASSIIAEAVAAGAATVAFRKSPGAMRTERWRENKRHKASPTVTERHTPKASPTVTERHQPSQSDAHAVSPIDTNIKNSKRQNSERPSRGTRIPSDWIPGPDGHAFALAEGLSVYEIGREASRFRDYWGSRAGSGGVKLNWMLTWQNWIRTTAEKLGKTPRPSGPEGAVTGFYAKFGSEEQDAWDRYGRETKGKAFPRDKSGGWNFPVQWPPGYTPQPKGEPIPIPKLRAV